MMNQHVPVLLAEVLEALITDPNGLYIDGTFGGGGHSSQILQKISENGKLIALDRDHQAVQVGQSNFQEFKNIQIHHQRFSNIDQVCKPESACGVLLDLGMSSNQIADPLRGFSYMETGDLDLRMNQGQGLTAYELIAELSEEELVTGLSNLGELRYARTVAHRMKMDVMGGKSKKEMVDWISSFARAKGLHAPRYLSQIFQALRMLVNDEESEIKKGLPAVWNCLQKGGRLVVISFHSVEDRWVKQFFVEQEKTCLCPPDLFQCICGNNHKKLKRLIKKPLVAGAKELAENPRSRSAKLRVGEKIK